MRWPTRSAPVVVAIKGVTQDDGMYGPGLSRGAAHADPQPRAQVLESETNHHRPLARLARPLAGALAGSTGQFDAVLPDLVDGRRPR